MSKKKRDALWLLYERAVATNDLRLALDVLRELDA